MQIICSACGGRSDSLIEFECSRCASPLQVLLEPNFEPTLIDKKRFSLWRYRSFFPYVKEDEIISLGEGWTPLTRFSNNIYFKLDFLSPTGSFKDRGSSVLVSSLHRHLKEVKGFFAEDSSGNAGASIAAYAAYAGLKARIYVPKDVKGQKINQILSYGADLIKVPGSRNNVSMEAQRDEEGKFYVGHVKHPLFNDGMRSAAYELAEQFNWKFPEHVFLPVSSGTLLLGLIRGFQHLNESGHIRSVPKIIACQTNQVSPLYHAFKGLSYTPPSKVASLADALLSVNPPFLNLMNQGLRRVGGDVEIVGEKDVLSSFKELARKGFFVEPSSAVAVAGLKKYFGGKVQRADCSVVILTGTGLKSGVVNSQHT